MKLIETKILGTAAASIEFTSIPQGYTDLVILASLRVDNTGNPGSTCLLKMNSVTTGYTTRILSGSGSAASSSVDTTSAGFAIISSVTAAATTNTFSNNVVYLSNYAGSTAKSASSDAVTENNATNSFQSIRASVNTSTAAITSLTFTDASAGNFQIGSTISIYGITKGSDGITTAS